MSKRVRGSGPIPAECMLIGQRPGQMECRVGKPFVGPAGQELDRYLSNNSGVSRDSVYCTNLVKDFDGVDEPTAEEIERDWLELVEEIEMVRPRYIGLVGAYAARRFLPVFDDMDTFHGLAFPPVGRCSFWAMPLWHPSAGLHEPSKAARIAWDFEQFGKMVRGEDMPTGHLQDIWPDPHYEDFAGYRTLSPSGAVDTEGTVEKPWCLSFSNVAGCGGVIRQGFGTAIEIDDEIILHNALHDLPVLEAMGVRVGKWTDSMIKAALLGTEPQSLKALARRHCGMVMREYADVVRAAQQEKALEYLSEVVDYADANR